MQRHGYKLGYTTTRLYLQKTGAVQPAPRRGVHRRKRPRRPMCGMLLHQDASKHRWLTDQPALDLVITPTSPLGDDATSTIYSAFLVPEEGTHSSFQGLVEVIERHGLFARFRESSTPIAAATTSSRPRLAAKCRRPSSRKSVGPSSSSDVAAYSPEARGRCERAFRTLQDRLPKEFQLAGITTIEAANRFLREVYLGEHNHRFAVPAEEPASAFVVVPEALWRDVLSIQEERRVGNDNCVAWRGRHLQIPPTPLRPHLVRARVRIHDYPDGTIAIFKGPRRLASFPPAAPASTEELAA